MRRFLILWHILVLPWLAFGQNCGIVDTILIGTNRTETYRFDVTDVVNNDLADPNQGICGIEIEFLHQFVENMELWVTSPSGQMVQLMGPNSPDALAFTFGARWDITFVPCGATAQPDSGYVAKWDNNQPRNFVSGGRYTGSYYPFIGCLEDFNTGPVNGQWTITVRNNPSVYQGAIVNFRLRLCDERGFICCFADAGSLASYPDVNACEGSAALNLNIPPVYAFLPPDTSEYAYTYIISQNDAILAYDSLTDLRSYAPGTYTVCGLSYKKTDRDSFPAPGMQSLSTLRQQLNGNLLLYCGNITSNCVDVTISTPGDTTFLNETICRGETFQIGSNSYNTSGEYDATIPGTNGCDSIVHLTLTVVDPTITNISQVICAGDSVVVGTSVYKTSGNYSNILTSSNGCDSTINLNLTVLDPIETNVTASICSGEVYRVGNDTFTVAGSYEIVLTSALGCDSTVNLSLSVLRPQAAITTFGNLDCNNASVTLDGNGSTPVGNLSFQWFNASGMQIGATPTLEIGTPGNYFLQVTQTANGAACTARDTVTIVQNTNNPPVASIATPATLGCANPQVVLNANGSTQGSGVRYQWTGPGILNGATTLTPAVNAPGIYRLIVTSASSLCADTASVTVNQDLNAPTSNAGNGDTINCNNPTVTLGGNNTSTGPNITYFWQTQGGNFVGSTNQRTATVNAPGTYTLIVTDTNSGCADTSLTTVALDTLAPIANAGDDALITCGAPDAVLDGSGSQQGQNIRYTWTNAAGVLIGNDIIALVTQPGHYFLQVVNITTGCSARDSVEVRVEQGVPTITFGDTLISCNSNFLTLQAFVDPPDGNYVYDWSGPGIQSPPNQPVVQVNSAGNYIFTVRNLDNDCSVSDTAIVVKQNCDICIQGSQPDTLTCINTSVMLQATFCAPCDNCTIVWTTPDGNFVSGTDGLTPTVNAPGTYTLTVTNSTNFSTSLDFVVVENVALPTADAGVDAIINCNQLSVIIGGNGTSTGPDYVPIWMAKSGAPISPNNQAKITVSQPDTYYLEVLNVMTGCIAADSVVVSIDTIKPTAEAGASVVLTCNSPTASLNGAGTSTGANFIYNWTTSNGNIISGANTLTPTVNAAGTYVLTVKNNQNSCAAMDSVVVTSDDLPVIPMIPDTALTCINETIVVFGAVPSNGNFQAQWCELDASDNPVNCINSQTLNVTAPGRYIFEITNQDNGCSASRIATVSDNRISPAVEAGTNDTLACNQPDLVLNGAVTPANGNYTYQWIARNGSPIENPGILTPTVSQSDTYILAVTNLDNGCTGMDSVEILQNTETPIIFPGADTTLSCAVSSIQLNPQVIGNNLQYQWTTPDGNILSGANTSAPTVDAPGAYFLLVTNTANGCSAQDTFIVNRRNDSPIAIIANSGSDLLTCNNSIAILDGSNSTSQTGAVLQFSWRAINGQIVGNPTQASVQTSTGGMFELMVTDPQNGCTARDTVEINADFKTPDIATLPVEPITCLRTQTRIDAGNSVGTGGLVFRWIAPNGAVLPETTSAITVSTPGNYQLFVTSQGNGCTDSVTVSVAAQIDPPAVSIAPPTALDCEITSTQLVASATGGNGFTYAWRTQDGAILSGQNSSTASVGKSGTYTVAVIRADNGCTGEASILVEATERPIEQVFYSIVKPNCFSRASASVTIDSISGGTAPYVYSLFDSPFTSENIFENLATGTYDLVIQDRNGCEWESKVMIPAPDTIQIELSEDVEIDLGDSTELFVNTIPVDFLSIVWKTVEETDSTNALERTVTPVRTTVYTVEVTGTNGCVATAQVTVFVNETTALFAPNAFTPDGDGINDVFMLFAGQTVKEIKSFMIFDRWGDRVYEAGPFQPNDPQFGWDGYHNGVLMNPAVFVFFAEVKLVDGRTVIVEGDVTLLR